MRDRYRNKRNLHAVNNPNQSYSKASNYKYPHYSNKRQNDTKSDWKRSGASESSWRTSESSYTSKTLSQTGYYGSEHKHSCFWRVVLNQRCYYLVGLLLNALLLSLYTVMAFTSHVPCLGPRGSNVTKGFEFCFKLGFYACAADFINAAFFEFYIRQRNHVEMSAHGFVSRTT